MFPNSQNLQYFLERVQKDRRTPELLCAGWEENTSRRGRLVSCGPPRKHGDAASSREWNILFPSEVHYSPSSASRFTVRKGPRTMDVFRDFCGSWQDATHPTSLASRIRCSAGAVNVYNPCSDTLSCLRQRLGMFDKALEVMSSAELLLHIRKGHTELFVEGFLKPFKNRWTGAWMLRTLLLPNVLVLSASKLLRPFANANARHDAVRISVKH